MITFHDSPTRTVSPRLKEYLNKQVTRRVAKCLLAYPIEMVFVGRGKYFCFAPPYVWKLRRVKTPTGWAIEAHSYGDASYYKPDKFSVEERNRKHVTCEGWTAEIAIGQYRRYLTKCRPTGFSLLENGIIMHTDQSGQSQECCFELSVRGIEELRTWFLDNSAKLCLPEEIGSSDFMARCIDAMRSDLPLMDKSLFIRGSRAPLWRLHFLRCGKRYSFIIPIDIEEGLIIPYALGAPLEGWQNEESSAWTCYVEDTFNDHPAMRVVPNHYYRASEATPLGALSAACKLAKDPIRISDSGDIYLGSSQTPRWIFSRKTAHWKRNPGGLRWKWGNFGPYFREQIWAKVPTPISDLLILDAVLS